MAKCPFCDRNNPDGVESCPGCGAWLEKSLTPQREDEPSGQDSQAMDDALAAELAPLIASGLIINAVKRYREATGASLVEAKNAVEQLRDRGTIQKTVAASDSTRSATYEQAVLELVRQNRPIDAIRLYRQQHGTDLKTSKQAIEELAQRHGIPLKIGGCGSVVVLLALLLVVAGAVVAAVVFLQG